MELKRLFDDEEGNKKKKNKILALKFTNVKDMTLEDEDCRSESDEEMNFMFCKFKEFLRHEKKTFEFQNK